MRIWHDNTHSFKAILKLARGSHLASVRQRSRDIDRISFSLLKAGSVPDTDRTVCVFAIIAIAIAIFLDSYPSIDEINDRNP